VITHAQNFEDVMLARIFAGQRTGFYVDVGASHPDILSVTRHFYDLGWSGINVEPIRRNIELFEARRPRDTNLCVAIGRPAGDREFFEVEGYDALSTFDSRQAEDLELRGYRLKRYRIPVVSADSIFETYRLDQRCIDFLKIDVEGLEGEVLASLDLKRFRPRVLVVEAIAPAYDFPGWDRFDPAPTHESWEPGVLAAAYTFAHWDGISRYYLRDADRQLEGRFKVPPGVFDGIVFAREDAALSAERTAREGVEAALSTERAAREGAEAALSVERTAREGVEAARSELESALASAERAFATEQAARHAAEADTLAERGKGVRARLRDLRIKIRESAEARLRGRLLRLAAGHSAGPLPRISLVIPVLNGAAYVAETLESVLCHTYPDLEVIVVDGGSIDGTLDIVQEFSKRTDAPQRIAKVLSGPDRGMYDAIGKGFDAATGEILCYLNSDDQLEAGGLLAVGHHFARQPGAQVLYHEDTVLSEGWKFPNVRQPWGIDVPDLLDRHILFQDGVFFRRAAYEASGGIRRDLRLAGDYDLWLRLAAVARFERRPRHVSCFRIRPGQLSTDVSAYRAEMELAREQFLRSSPVWRRAAWAVRGWGRRVARWMLSWRQDRLFFPIDFGNLPPPPAVAPRVHPPQPRSPIDGAPAERLLFSCMDTRFGDRNLNYIYLDSRHGVSIAFPPMDSKELDALYRENYSSPPTEARPPAGTSPYRQFDRMPRWERALLRLPVERLNLRSLQTDWGDPTLSELTGTLRACGLDTASRLELLDAGCFEGRLLDQVRSETPWRGFGLEPNPAAVAIARGKGHEVWQGHAENAPDLVPPGRLFDAIFLGQSIEHVDDPVLVLRRLRTLVAPGGALVVSTPSMDSRQIDWFGPTWAHWHPPYHRYIFSRKGLVALAERAGLRPVCLRSFSHPYWTCMTLAQNQLGLGGAVSHAVTFEPALAFRAGRIDFWSRVLWNRLGRGDYFLLAMMDRPRG
jgi:FkbM family methyltransferase